MKKTYELIEHTADIGIKVKAKSLRALFRRTAGAAFSIFSQRKKRVSSKAKNFQIKQAAGDIEELLINWLNELFSLSQAKGVVFSSFKIIKLDTKNIEARISGYPIGDYEIKKEIKAATYHNLKIRKVASGWQAEVILDV